MDFLKKAKTTMKDVQDIQKGMKDLGFKFGGDKDKSKSASQSTASTAAPSIAPSSVAPSSSAAVPTPGTTPAASKAESINVGNLSVPVCQKEGAPSKIPLTGRKMIRDDFEAKKADQEAQISKLLGTPWTIHVDVPGVYTYMGNDTGATKNPGSFMHQYFNSAIRNLQSFKEKYGAADLASINEYAAQHIVTLEPTSNESVRYNDTDFFEGRWRLLFRDTMFGYNIDDAASKLGETVNIASKTGGAADNPANPPMSLKARKGIRDQYEAKIGDELAKAKKWLATPELTFIPNFEVNYAILAAFKATEDPDERPVLRNDWEQTLGEATLGYFSGFVSQLDWQKFKGDDMMQEGFKEAIPKLTVAFVVSQGVSRSYNDCVIEDGMLVIRTKPDQWWTNVDGACEKLSDLL